MRGNQDFHAYALTPTDWGRPQQERPYQLGHAQPLTPSPPPTEPFPVKVRKK